MDTRSFRQAARAWLDAHAEEMVADLQSFARIRSVSRADLAEEGAPFGDVYKRQASASRLSSSKSISCTRAPSSASKGITTCLKVR